jgi:hypothetical protein
MSVLTDKHCHLSSTSPHFLPQFYHRHHIRQGFFGCLRKKREDLCGLPFFCFIFFSKAFLFQGTRASTSGSMTVRPPMAGRNVKKEKIMAIFSFSLIYDQSAQLDSLAGPTLPQFGQA